MEHSRERDTFTHFTSNYRLTTIVIISNDNCYLLKITLKIATKYINNQISLKLFIDGVLIQPYSDQSAHQTKSRQ